MRRPSLPQGNISRAGPQREARRISCWIFCSAGKNRGQTPKIKETRIGAEAHGFNPRGFGFIGVLKSTGFIAISTGNRCPAQKIKFFRVRPQNGNGAMMQEFKIRRAAVLGAGVMGSKIAAHLANVGIPSYLLDIAPAELTDAEKRKGLA